MRSIKNIEKKDWLFFSIGIVISVLFVIFSTEIYELFFYEPEFANEMYNQNMYTVCAIMTVAACWFVAIVYYWILEIWVTCDRWYHWLISIVVALLLAPAVTFYYSDYTFTEQDLDFYAQELNFAFVSLAVTFVLYLIVCFSVKGFSLNNRNTPF